MPQFLSGKRTSFVSLGFDGDIDKKDSFVKADFGLKRPVRFFRDLLHHFVVPGSLVIDGSRGNCSSLYAAVRNSCSLICVGQDTLQQKSLQCFKKTCLDVTI
jgi:hypothetical protein